MTRTIVLLFTTQFLYATFILMNSLTQARTYSRLEILTEVASLYADKDELSDVASKSNHKTELLDGSSPKEQHHAKPTSTMVLSKQRSQEQGPLNDPPKYLDVHKHDTRVEEIFSCSSRKDSSLFAKGLVDETSRKRPASVHKDTVQGSSQPKLLFVRHGGQTYILKSLVPYDKTGFSHPTHAHLTSCPPSSPHFTPVQSSVSDGPVKQLGSHISLPVIYGPTSSGPSTSAPQGHSAQSNSRAPASEEFRRHPENNQADTMYNIPTKMSSRFPGVIFLTSSDFSDIQGAILLRAVKGSSIHRKDVLKSYLKTIGNEDSQTVYRVFLICKNLKNHYNQNMFYGIVSLDNFDARIKTYFDTSDHLRDPQVKLDLINDARMQLFVYKETSRARVARNKTRYHFLNMPYFLSVSERFSEYKLATPSSNPNDPWKGFLEDCRMKKIRYFSYSEVLHGIELVSYFDIKYSGVSTQKAFNDKGNRKHGGLDVYYKTLYFDIYDGFGEKRLKRFDIKFIDSPVFKPKSNYSYFASELTGVNIYFNVEFE